MFAPIIAILAAGLLGAMWPGPKLNHQPPTSGGVFAPHFQSDLSVRAPTSLERRTFTASTTAG